MNTKKQKKSEKTNRDDPSKNKVHTAMAVRAGYFTIAEASKRVCVNVTTIYRLIRRGHLDTFEFGSLVLVSAQSLLAYYGQLKEMRARITKGVPLATLRKPEKLHWKRNTCVTK